ncbi:sortase domain-containing protein [Streptomyces melanogenes]|uniref:sortase domain-containing protein n=1 Tax=Streptomyces melanogenes TaxID=67326 RepID=UPI0037B5F4BA
MSTPARPRPRLLAATAVALTATAALTACGSGPDLPPAPEISSTATAPASRPAPPLPKSRPTGMRIDAAGVDAKKMLDLKVNASRELGVPDPDTDADTPGWWAGGVTPGEVGAAILVAHYDTKHGPALLRNVKKIKLGDTVKVPREDGRTATFKIREIEEVEKKDFPTDKVYGETRRPELRLLTCGGEVRNGHRTSNIIFYADLLGS